MKVCSVNSGGRWHSMQLVVVGRIFAKGLSCEFATTLTKLEAS